MQLSQDYIAIEFRDDSLTAIEFTGSWGRLILKSYSCVRLEPGIIAQGIIQNEDALKLHIDDLIKKSLPKPMHTENVLAIVSEDVVFHTCFEVSNTLTDKELNNIIPIKAESFIPFNAEDIFWDFKVKPDTDKNNPLVIQYIAAPKNAVQSYDRVLSSLGLNMQMLTSTAESYVEVIRDLPDKIKNVLVIEIENDFTNVFLYKEGLMTSTKNIRVGARPFLNKLAEQYGMNMEELLRMLSKKEMPEMNFPEQEQMYNDFVTQINLGIASTVQNDEIHAIFVWGTGLRVPNMLSILKEKLQPLPQVDLIWKQMTMSRTMRKADLIPIINENVLNFGVTVGGAYNFMNPFGNKMLNLLPADRKTTVGNNVVNAFMNRLGLLIILLNMGLIFLLSYMFLSFNFELNSLKQETAVFEDLIYGERYYELRDDINSFNADINELYLLGQEIKNIPEVITSATETPTEGVSLSNIYYSKEEGMLKLTGVAATRQALVQYKDALASNETFGNVDAPLSNFDDSSDIVFDINISLNPPEIEPVN